MKKDRKIRRELLDELLAGYKTPEDLTGPEGILKQLTGALVERALEAELTDHLGYDEHAVEGRGSGNSRNGSGTKTLQTDQGPVPIEVPRDRNSSFEPQLVKKHQRRFKGFDDKILALYARGMSVLRGAATRRADGILTALVADLARDAEQVRRYADRERFGRWR